MAESKNLGSLPEEILYEILFHLPVKSLSRFRFVSKSWKNLIVSNEYFVNSHLKRSIANKECHLKLLILESMDNELDEDLSADNQAMILRGLSSVLGEFDNHNNPVLDLGKQFNVAGCVNGVICLFKHGTSTLYLWNPALHECRSVCSRISWTAFMGFVYDLKNQDYIILQMSSWDEIVEIELYSLKNNSWKEVQCLLHPPFKWFHRMRQWQWSSVYLNGCCHWIARFAIGVSILAFDIVREEINVLRLPSSRYDVRLGVVDECIAIVVENNWQRRWDVWLMKTYGVAESWTKFLTIPDIVPDIGICSLVCMYTNGKILFKDSEYDVVQGKFSNEYRVSTTCNILLGCLHGTSKGHTLKLCHFVDYVESLISVMPS